MMKKQIALVKGDGIGPEVVNEGIKVLKTIEKYTDYSFEFKDAPMGGEVWKNCGESLPQTSLNIMAQSDTILFGAVGLPDIPQGVAEKAILKVRQDLDLYVNLRPVKLYPSLHDMCPLKPEIVENGIDIAVFRENTESVYAQIGGIVNQETAVNSMVYTRKGVSRIIEYAFEYVSRNKFDELISVDKANVLTVSQFWRQIYQSIGKKYPSIKQTSYYVDAFCQWLIRAPSSIHTVVTENMFGDIVSDEAAYLVGSLGMGASGNINPNGVSMYEPIHGSAPDIAGQGIANPIGTILSVKMMFEESFQDAYLGEMIDKSVEIALEKIRTIDIYSKYAQNNSQINRVNCTEMGDAVCIQIKSVLKK
ncbi:3-isopropylmalate/3-methylmalate dehydrogenase [Candidatus Lokiarchaeum ossiferum]|uniref:3-isopropylmalate dehydrogenase n=1 Tax=Candidatus Lokiarchaeum ossiferum TaxID=2951803 RepID=A0ABY6HW90_9ARCH|nr:3-isopropylmalate/3-methylmalate dehydrogenase [Candidatus Lokiarchaeum sp. B-35]